MKATKLIDMDDFLNSMFNTEVSTAHLLMNIVAKVYVYESTNDNRMIVFRSKGCSTIHNYKIL